MAVMATTTIVRRRSRLLDDLVTPQVCRAARATVKRRRVVDVSPRSP